MVRKIQGNYFMIFVAETKNGESVTFRDRKRYLWFFSVLTPTVPGLCALALLSGGSEFWAFIPLLFYYVGVPLLDTIVGEDDSNPPEEVVEKLSADNFYRVLLHLTVPVFYFSFLSSAIAAGTLSLSLPAFVALALGAGIASGAGLTVGHELGHKQSWVDRLSARLVLAVTGYAHFSIEHNQGHHKEVATPEDPASARFNESVFAFALREIPGAANRGWALEAKRLEKRGINLWSWRNELLQGYALTLAIAAILVFLLGWIMLPFLILHHLFGWYQLTMANYVEHYGLKRDRKENGRYAPCEPRHSWNTNHIVSNLMLFHLQRHSDHHANPIRPYQALRDFAELPRLPSGYPGSFLLALIPPLWFRTMNPKVMAWADGDMARVNTGV